MVIEYDRFLREGGSSTGMSLGSSTGGGRGGSRTGRGGALATRRFGDETLARGWSGGVRKKRNRAGDNG